MTAELARSRPVSIRRPTDEANPFARFRPLDQHSGARIEMPETPSFTATISAGWKDEKGIPNISRDGKIHLVDPDKRAPFLAECLAATQFKRLTIAFTSNNPADLVQERFVAYSASSLQLHGDETGITYLDGKGGRRYFAAGTDEFQRAIAKCAVTRSLYFVLAGWDGQRPVMLFDPRDGLTHHRLRFSSRNSLNNIMRQLAEVAAHTNGEIVGLPFELSITYRDVADPTGKRRTVPIWSLVFKPPTGLTLTASSFRQIVTAGLEEGRQLQLPPPPESEAIELAASEYRYLADDEAVDVAAGPDPNQLAVMQRGVAVDGAAARRRWFSIARGSVFGTDEGRCDFLSAWTDGNFDSLSVWLKVATQQEVDACLDTLERAIECVPPVLPRAWEGLTNHQSDHDTPDDFHRAVDDARAAQQRPAQVIDLETGAIAEHGPDPEPESVPVITETPVADDYWADLDEEQSTPVSSDQDVSSDPDEDLDQLSLYRQRRDAIESAKDTRALGLAGHDVARDENILSAEQIKFLRAAYQTRSAALAAE